MEERIGFCCEFTFKGKQYFVLILIVMEERIGFRAYPCHQKAQNVLILIVMEERIGW